MAFKFFYLAVILFLNFNNYLSSATFLNDYNEADILDILSSSGINFTFNVYRQLPSHGNLFFSPISLSTTLSMVMQGAKGDSLNEIRNVLQYNPQLSIELINYGMNQSINILRVKDKDCVLNLANRLYIQKKISLLANFRNTVKTYYQGGSINIDFAKDITKAKQKINKWVSKKTKGKIPELFSSLDASTRLLLVNAIYFSGTWKTKFPKESILEVFKPRKDLQLSIKMMVLSKMDLKYAEDVSLKCKIIELPYKGKTFSMFIILPNEIDGLEDVEKEINDNKFKSLQSKMSLTQISKLKLPKFKLSEEYDMIPVFSKLGMDKVFNSNADFSGITTKIPLQISQIVHKAIIKVNEEGSEAAAATGIGMITRMRVIEPEINFIADHPFMFIIWNQRIKNILFIGRIKVPSEL